MTILLLVLAFTVGWLIGHVGVNAALDRLSDSRLADIYRREHQRQLEGRLGWWE